MFIIFFEQKVRVLSRIVCIYALSQNVAHSISGFPKLMCSGHNFLFYCNMLRVDKINFHAYSDGSDSGSDKDAGAGERKKHQSEFFLMIFSNSLCID
jgi:hypothetical protein